MLRTSMCIQGCIEEYMYALSNVWVSLNAMFSRGVSLSIEKRTHKHPAIDNQDINGKNANT